MARFDIIGNTTVIDASQYVVITRRISPLQTYIRVRETAPSTVTVKCSDTEGGAVSYTTTIMPDDGITVTGRGLYLVEATCLGDGVLYSGKPKYNGIFGKPSYLEFAEIASPKPLNFEIGNYVDYSRTGIRYKLYRIPQVDKSARKNEAGDAFVYRNVQFFAPTKDLELALFRDLVMNDNLIHFSSIPNVDTYEDVAGIARRIQANMDAFAGEGVWDINVYESEDADYNELISQVKQFSLSDGTCIDALNKIYELWRGIGWVYQEVDGVHTVWIGRPNLQEGDNTTDVFRYGKGNGLKVISRADSANSEIATRVYAYGSERNLPSRYYNKIEPNILDNESVYIPHLMLPLSDWGYVEGDADARLAYLQSDNATVRRLGLIPKILRFDGTGDLEEIYPSIEGMTIGQVVSSGYPSTGYRLNERVDELKDAVNPSDDGVYTDETGSRVIRAYDGTVTPWDFINYVIPGQSSLRVSMSTPIAHFEGTMQEGRFRFTTDGEGLISLSDEDKSIFNYIKFGTKPEVYAEVWYDKGMEGEQKATVIPLDVVNDTVQGGFSFKLEKFSSKSTVYVHTIDVLLFINAEFDKKETEEIGVSILFNIGEAKASLQYDISSTFQVTLKQIGFNIKDMGSALSGGYATLSMKSGKCAGREFLVKDVVYDEEENEWILTCQRQEDSSIGQWFPNNIYQLEAGDRFVLLDLEMPEAYVSAAMSRLHDAAARALARLENPKRVYTPTVDSKAILMSEIALLEGMYMPVEDNDLIGEGETEYVLINTLTIAENDDAIPIYSVTLRDEKPESIFEKITGEITRGNKFIDDIVTGDTRGPAPDPDENIKDNVLPRVMIEMSKDFLLDADEGLALTAVTEGISLPVYQWYYLDASQEWVAIEDATSQAFYLESDDERFFPSGDSVADIRVEVFDGEDGEQPYYASALVSKIGSGLNGLTLYLSSPAILFEATDTHAVQKTYTTDIIAYSGSTRIYPTITDSDITGQVTGLTTQAVVVSNRTYVRIFTATTLVTKAGSLTINVPINGVNYPLVCSWALDLQGAPGNDGENGDDGDDGYSQATIYMYQRFPTDAPSSRAIGQTRYNFATDALTEVATDAFNGWTREIPSGSGAVYVTSAHASSNTGPVILSAGWKPSGPWSVPVRLTGESGRMGKIMRGVNRWDGTFIPSGGWQGMNDADGEFYDVVVYSVYDSAEGKYVDKYYYLTSGSHGSENPATSSYWVEAEDFDFIATKVLLAENAFIDILGGNAIYLYGNDGSASGQVVAGIQGGSSDINGDPQVNFFAGSGSPQDAPFRVYYDGTLVAAKGQFGCMEIGVDTAFGNALIGTEVFGQSGRAGDLETLISPRGFKAYNTGGVDYDACTIAISPYPSAMGDSNGVMAITTEDVEVFTVMRNGNMACQDLDCQNITANDITANAVIAQDIRRPLTSSVNEDMVGSLSLKHIWIGSYLDYISLTKSNDTIYIIISGGTSYMGIYVGSVKVASL